jgi:hypothetical protein
MKTKQITLGLASLVMVASLAFTSCRKKDKTSPVEPDTDQTTAKDNNLSESINSDIEAMGSQAAENNTGSSSSLSTYKTLESIELAGISAATITVVGKVITVDFGTPSNPTTGLDGRVRSGKLVYDYSASTPTTAVRYRNPGFKLSVSTQSYVVDGNSVNILSKTITNTTPLSLPTGTNPGTNLTWAISANVSIVKGDGSGTISWTCNRTKELTNTSDPLCYKGQSLPIDWTKAKVKINGTASGTNKLGESFSAVASSLVRDFTCPAGLRRHFVSGQIAYTPGSKPTRTIDYGDGTCDNNATLTVNGNTYAITLP